MSQSDSTYRKTILIAAIVLALAVILGAFGAHALKAKLSDYQLGIFETGIRYHFIHGIGILALVGLKGFISTKELKIIKLLLILGILFFSGSLYLLATRELFGIEHWKFLGPLTPIGGLFFIMAWLYLGYASFKYKQA